MQLIKRGSTEGLWYEYEENAKPIASPKDRKPPKEGEEANSCFRIRRIPSAYERECYFRHFTKKAELKRKDGALISSTDLEKNAAYKIDLACYALVETFDAEFPAELFPGLLEGSGMVSTPATWTEEFKRAVFQELLPLAAWIVDRADSQTQGAAKESEELGKTS